MTYKRVDVAGELDDIIKKELSVAIIFRKNGIDFCVRHLKLERWETLYHASHDDVYIEFRLSNVLLITIMDNQVDIYITYNLNMEVKLK